MFSYGLTKSINSLYPRMIAEAEVILGKNVKMLYNPNRLVKFDNEMSERTYEGNSSVTIDILHKILLENCSSQNYPNLRKIQKIKEDGRKHILTHSFLMTSDIIIDPTWRKFLRHPDFELETKGYENHIYTKLYPIFVGTFEELNMVLYELELYERKNYTLKYIDWKHIPIWYTLEFK